MRRLAFKKTYVDLIVEGRKTSTLRKTTAIEEGDLVAMQCEWGKPPFAYVRVTKVRPIAVWKLTHEIARAEGFERAEDLVKALAEHYPGVTEFVQIEFEKAPVALVA